MKLTPALFLSGKQKPFDGQQHFFKNKQGRPEITNALLLITLMIRDTVLFSLSISKQIKSHSEGEKQKEKNQKSFMPSGDIDRQP